jgi:hypothetical protein
MTEMRFSYIGVFLLIATSLASAASHHAAEWMGQMGPTFANRTLDRVLLPGTHDSGAFVLGTQLVPGATSDVLEEIIKARAYYPPVPCCVACGSHIVCGQVAEELGIPIEDVITPWALAQV